MTQVYSHASTSGSAGETDTMMSAPKAQPTRNRSGKRTADDQVDSGETPPEPGKGAPKGPSSQVTGQRGDGENYYLSEVAGALSN